MRDTHEYLVAFFSGHIPRPCFDARTEAAIRHEVALLTGTIVPIPVVKRGTPVPGSNVILFPQRGDGPAKT